MSRAHSSSPSISSRPNRSLRRLLLQSNTHPTSDSRSLYLCRSTPTRQFAQSPSWPFLVPAPCPSPPLFLVPTFHRTATLLRVEHILRSLRARSMNEAWSRMTTATAMTTVTTLIPMPIRILVPTPTRTVSRVLLSVVTTTLRRDTGRMQSRSCAGIEEGRYVSSPTFHYCALAPVLCPPSSITYVHLHPETYSDYFHTPLYKLPQATEVARLSSLGSPPMSSS